MPRADGPFKILEKINDNAYKLDIPADYGVSSSFNVVDFKPYEGEEEQLPLRTTSIQEGEDDEDTISLVPATSSAVATTPEMIQGPMTQACACELNYMILLRNEGPKDGNK